MGQPFSVAGAHIKCFVNEKLLGYVTGIPAWNVLSTWGELREIDSVRVRQLSPRAFSVSGTVQVLRGRNTGGLEGAGLVTSARRMLQQKYLTIELQDRISQAILFRAVACQVDGQQWQVTPKGLILGTFNFKGLDFGSDGTGNSQ